MNRQYLYISNDGPTFEHDEQRPHLPLPKLEESLERYYQALIPFGNAAELENSRKIIGKFKNGIGKKLQEILEQRATTHKNWVEKWWEDYAYLTDRTPLLPFAAMVQPLLIEAANIEVSSSYRFKTASHLTHHFTELWNIIRAEQLKQATNPDGSVIYSNFLYRRAYNTIREPGETMDKIKCYFKTVTEGQCSSNVIVLGKGRIFCFDALNKNGDILTKPHFYAMFQRIANVLAIESEAEQYPVPVLTCDNRTKWAQNRQYLKELSEKNANYLDIIEQALIVICLDSNCPSDWSEISMKTLCGDMHNRWADKSSSLISFDNGTIGCTGEHSCYDGSISISVSTFLMLSLMEFPEPNWNEQFQDNVEMIEIIFDMDDHVRQQIKEAIEFTNTTKMSIIVSTTAFDTFGKTAIKSLGFNPDVFIQLVLQLTYFNMHEEFVPTYETALMRKYYNGRTETVRPCTVEAVQWVNAFKNKTETNENKLRTLKEAAKVHTNLMNLARNGNGFDRHLFGLWCAAYESDIDIPELYDDPLYKKSGGGGNFVLSTSTLGYTINNGLVAPMCTDGYGVFYSMTEEIIWMNITAFRESTKTSAHQFAREFGVAMIQTREMIQSVSNSKL